MKHQHRFSNKEMKSLLNDSRLRIALLALFFLLVFGVLLIRLYYLQLHHGEEHRSRIDNQSIRRIRTPGWRGSIYGSDGLLLAGNQTVYDLVFFPEGMRTGGRVKTIKHMAETARKLASVIGREKYPGEKEISWHLHVTPGMPLNVFPALDEKERALLFEAARDIKGIDIQISTRRIYPQRTLAAHIIGYSRKAQEDTAADREDFFYYQPDIIGVAGIERAFDQLPGQGGHVLGLRAYPGRQVVQVSNFGYVKKELVGRVDPIHGNNVILTIDAEAQKIAEELLAGQTGSIVVLDADNGDIICAATSPSYDLSRFTPRLSPEYYNSLRNDPKRPLINRAAGGIYPPGSTLKPLICLALLKAGIDPAEKILCTGEIRVKNVVIRCQAHRYVEADVDMETALEKSCNSYMIHQSLRVGYDRIAEMLHSIGVGEKCGIEIPESAGHFPNKERKKRLHGIVWNDYDTALLSIGQGFISMTPLQLARYAAAICNGGKIYQPHLVYRVSDNTGTAVFNRQVKVDRQLPASPEMLEVIKRGMFRVVNANRGSGRFGKSANLEIYGKTGTAELGTGKKLRNITHFIAFTSYEGRRYAIAVTVEDGASGGRSCAPLAAAFFESYLKPESEKERGFML